MALDQIDWSLSIDNAFVYLTCFFTLKLITANAATKYRMDCGYS